MPQLGKTQVIDRLHRAACDQEHALRDARLSWKAHGRLAATHDNVIVYPTSDAARHSDLEWLIGPAGILDPDRWFIVICDRFGNGLSSSPSNTPDYPTLVTPYDNVVVQQRAVQERFGIDQRGGPRAARMLIPCGDLDRAVAHARIGATAVSRVDQNSAG